MEQRQNKTSHEGVCVEAVEAKSGGRVVKRCMTDARKRNDTTRQLYKQVGEGDILWTVSSFPRTLAFPTCLISHNNDTTRERGREEEGGGK